VEKVEAYRESRRVKPRLWKEEDTAVVGEGHADC
jgi:hypothetical protein